MGIARSRSTPFVRKVELHLGVDVPLPCDSCCRVSAQTHPNHQSLDTDRVRVTIYSAMNRGEGRGTVITVGTFDGVHCGHRLILRRMEEIACTEGLERVIYAFAFPPRFSLDGERSGLLLPEQAKVALLARCAERVERADFQAVSGVDAVCFARDHLIRKFSAQVIVVGERFRFGRGRSGDIPLLRRIGEEEEVRIVTVPPLLSDGAMVSSTRIRSLLHEGKIAATAALLGRPPLLIGRVLHGDRLGRELGYPTANLAIDPAILLPATGVYLVHAFWDDGGGAGILYIGDRPTLKRSEMRCEVHLFSPQRTDFYEQKLEVHMLDRLRGDRAFPSLVALRQQIDRDVACAHSLLAARNEEPHPIFTLKSTPG